MLKNFLLVGIGGFAGSIARYYFSYTISKTFPVIFPLGTFSVNVIGSFLIGLIYGFTEENPLFVKYRLLLATGFCGGFTTFSSFTSENLSLLEKNEYFLFFVYTTLSVVLGIIGVGSGVFVSKYLK